MTEIETFALLQDLLEPMTRLPPHRLLAPTMLRRGRERLRSHDGLQFAHDLSEATTDDRQLWAVASLVLNARRRAGGAGTPMQRAALERAVEEATGTSFRLHKRLKVVSRGWILCADFSAADSPVMLGERVMDPLKHGYRLDNLLDRGFSLGRGAAKQRRRRPRGSQGRARPGLRVAREGDEDEGQEGRAGAVESLESAGEYLAALIQLLEHLDDDDERGDEHQELFPRRKRGARESGPPFTLQDDQFEAVVADQHQLYGQVTRYEAERTDCAVRKLTTHYGLDQRERMMLRCLIALRVVGRMGGGIRVRSLGRLVGVASFEGLDRILRRFGRDGELARQGVVEDLEPSVRPIDARVRLADEHFAEALKGAIRPSAFEGDVPGERPHRRGRGLTPGLLDEEGDTPWTLHRDPPSRPLVLPASVEARLHEAIEAAPLRKRVADELGYGDLLGYGLGTSMLFEGEPGTGKTLAAHVVAARLEKPLLEVPTARLLDMFVGNTERRISSVFECAVQDDAVLLLDEADSLLQSRASAERRWEVSTVNTLLHCIERHEGVVILTTNFVESLDPALERRLSLHLRFPRPGEAERLAIWVALTEGRLEFDDTVDLADVARRHPMTGAQIKSAVLQLALRQVSREGGATLTHDDLDDAVRDQFREGGRRDCRVTGF